MASSKKRDAKEPSAKQLLETVNMLRALNEMYRLSDDQRVTVMHNFCRFCGRVQKKRDCECNNDV